MEEAVVKAFVICEEITDFPGGSGQKNLAGAGLAMIQASGRFPIKRTFWAYAELTTQETAGNLEIAVMRADSGLRYFFRAVPIRFASPLIPTVTAIRVFEFVFPVAGVYFAELWYNGQWLFDQRLEIV